jgi:quinol monooxygenase YgiN
MYVAIYRWKIRPQKESYFVEQWIEMSQELKKTHGCLGARLHRHDDGSFVAYAQWSTKLAMHEARSKISEAHFLQVRNECIESHIPIGEMQVIANCLET